MKNKAIISLLALVLCIGVFFVPMTAYAAGDRDTTPPTISAKLDGGTLRIEASDDNSGVEAVYIDGNRVNSLANGKADVILKDYAGNGKQVSIYAVDYAGNRSSTVQIDNPYFQAPASLPTPTPPASSQTPAPSTPSTSQPPASSSTPAPSTSTPAPSSSSSDNSNSGTDGSDGTESAISEGDNVFTPEGTGTVVDIATDADGKLFYTIVTPAGNVFYLVIDLQRTDGNNVYFLNAVTEDDLLALAETDGSTTGGQSAIPTPDPEPTPDPTPEPEPTPDPEPEEQGTGGIGTIIFVILAIAAVGGAGYYIKIVRPKQQAAAFDDDLEDEDDEDQEGYPEGMGYEDGIYLQDDYDEQADMDAAEYYQTGDGSEADED